MRDCGEVAGVGGESALVRNPQVSPGSECATRRGIGGVFPLQIGEFLTTFCKSSELSSAGRDPLAPLNK